MKFFYLLLVLACSYSQAKTLEIGKAKNLKIEILDSQIITGSSDSIKDLKIDGVEVKEGVLYLSNTLQECPKTDFEDEYIEGTEENPDPYVPPVIEGASHNYTPKNMDLTKPFPDLSKMEKVASIPANKKEVVFPANERDIITIKEDVGKGTHYFLDYTFTFEKKFVFGRGGKFGAGFGLGKGTTGCEKIEEDGASVRFMWRGIKENGDYILNDFRKTAHAMLYIYDQNRRERCGDNYYFGKIEAGKKHRYTLEVKQEPNEKALINLWFDGKHVLNLKNLTLLSVNKIQEWFIYWQSFRGGSKDDASWRPPVTNRADIGEVIAYKQKN